MSEQLSPFSNPEAVARYADGPPRIVPGYSAMQRMTTLLLAERVPENGTVLVLGAGGGLELKEFAEAHRGWTFDGIDPSAEMLKLAERTLGPFESRVSLHQGYVDSAREGPFDAATCILTAHFMSPEERQRTAIEIRRRLRPGAPYVSAHLCIPRGQGDRALWLSRYAAFAIANGIEPGQVANGRTAIETKTHVLTPEEDEAILHAAGFSNVSLFYAAFTFRGWVAYA
ncbi:class I SAM-dependent methyltransferase [Bradyrhizobium sp. LHD-71]|uniref:class I SAM-dependent methyltransferase n=1 Tax=Bradyrhizobium sp. LHD-71 TaxID=3072141 RepID=UPI00280E4B29|nr:class I SAM-dependent methyltransferase [Bradyrhizobium sp. LHD-71]MDQ8727239.1 class I SAM-dependent methyltransferase [Bradyrhizobium sp. LHD-71]